MSRFIFAIILVLSCKFFCACSSTENSNAKLEIKFDQKTGTLVSAKSFGREMIDADASFPLFRVRFIDENGKTVEYSSNEAKSVSFDKNSIYFKNIAGREIDAKVDVVQKNGRAELNLEVTHNLEWCMEWIQFPCIFANELAKNGANLLISTNEGVLVEDIRHRETFKRYKSVEYPNGGWVGYYPGNVSMQFTTFTDNGKGLYICPEDKSCGTKEIDYRRSPVGGTEIIYKHYVSGAKKGTYKLPPFVIQAFEGDWHDGAAIYRKWAVDNIDQLPPPLHKNKNLPSWLADSPVILTYPCTGEGHHAGPQQPNEFVPFTNAAKYIDKYAEIFDSRIMALLMQWEGTAPWAPPFVWPPLGGEKSFVEFAELLHKNKNLLGVYCSGLAWTNKANTGSGKYEMKKMFEEKQLLKEMCMGPDGEYKCLICNGRNIRYGYDFCTTSKTARKYITDEALKIVNGGADYIQLFDQNLGGASYQCYDTRHNHPRGPGSWQKDSMRETMDTVLSAIKKSGHDKVLLGCEAAAAETYIGRMGFNDLRFNCGILMGKPVPAYSFVYHNLCSNFMGNQVETMGFIDRHKSPYNLYQRIAYSFSAGDILTLVLKDGGKISWAWCLKWKEDEPNQEETIALVKNLNAWRKDIGKDFLFYGTMEKPAKIGGTKIVKTKMKRNPDMAIDFESAFTSAWTSPDNRRAQFVVNYLPEVQHLEIDIPKNRKAYIYKSPYSKKAELMDSNKFAVQPLSAVMIEFK